MAGEGVSLKLIFDLCRDSPRGVLITYNVLSSGSTGSLKFSCEYAGSQCNCEPL